MADPRTGLTSEPQDFEESGMWQWRRNLIEKNNRTDPATTVVLNIVTLLTVTVLVVYTHNLFHRLGWLHSSRDLTWDDIGIAILTGSLLGIYEWSDRDKKRQIRDRKRKGLDATMV